MKKKVFKSLCIVCLLVGVILQFTQYQILKSLGSSIITTILVSLIWQYYIAEFDAEEMNQRFSKKVDDIESNIEKLIEKKGQRIEKYVYDTNENNKMLETVGLRYVCKNRAFLTDNIENILNNSSSSVKIMGESLSSFLDRPGFVTTLERNLKRGLKVKMLLLSLESDTLKERYEELGLKLNESVGMHKHALGVYFKLSQKYSRCEMKLFKYHPKILLIISDDQVIYTQHYSPGMKGYEAPLYKYYGGDSGVVKYYCDIFDNVWDADSTVRATYQEISFGTQDYFSKEE